MKTLSLLIFLLIGVQGSAQKELDLLVQKVDSLYGLEQYEDAHAAALMLTNLVTEKVGENNEQHFNAILLVGDCLFAMDKFSEAVTYYGKAKTIASVFEGKKFNYAFAQHSLGQVFLRLENFERAEEEMLSAGEIYEQSIGSENEFYLYLLSDLAVLYSSTNDDLTAYSIYTIYAPLLEKLEGEQSLNAALSYCELGTLAFEFGDYELAEGAVLNSLAILESHHPNNKLDILPSVLLTAKVYHALGEFHMVIPLLEEAYEMYKLVENQLENPTEILAEILLYNGFAMYELNDYAGAIEVLTEVKDKVEGTNAILAHYTLGKAQSSRGLKKEALEALKQAQQLMSLSKGYSNDFKVMIQNEIGVLEHSLAHYSTAITHYQMTLELMDEDDYGMRLTVMANLASLYSELGRFSEAENIYLDVLESAESGGGQVGLYITVLNNLGMLYMDWGDYSKCELLLNECVDLSENQFGKESAESANARNNLGTFYFEVGNYDKSVDYFVGALHSYYNIKGASSIEYSSVLNNIGILFIEVKEYEEALVYLDSARVIEANTIGKNHPEYAATLNNLSEVHSKLGNFKKAETQLTQAMTIVEGHFTDQHPDYALYLLNLGILQKDQGKLDQAKTTIMKAVQLHENIYGDRHANYAIAEFHYANLLSKQNKIIEAIPHYNSSIEILEVHLSNFLPFLSEKEKSGFYNRYIKYFHDYFRFAVDAKEKDPSIQGHAFDLSLTLKGMLLRSSRAMRNIVLNSGNDQLIKVYDDWVTIKKRISEISALPLEQRGVDLDELINEANVYEKKLYQLSDEIGASTLKQFNWKDIKEKLKENEAAVEFISFKNEVSGETQYGAMILRKNSTYPQLIELFEEDKLLKIIDFYGANDYDYIRKIYDYSADGKTELYDLIWKPLEATLGESTRIFVSSAGLLHRVSMYAIATGENKYLIDAYELISLNSAGDILDYNDIQSSSLDNIALMGGINYDTEESDKVVWEYLPGSKDEVEAINESLTDKKKNVSFKTAEHATETYFKEVAEESDIVHIATHGFFFPDPQKVWTMFEEDDTPSEELGFRGSNEVVGVTSFTKNKNPLMRSGLVFAGVHDLWSDDKKAKRDDGVLTALEVSQLNLANTELAVLSACETGLGEIIGEEGVYGLKRTFKIAGVKYLIISLWQVPDKETKEFMLLFYEELYRQEYITVYEAFESAQRQMRSKYDPYFWAAFVLIR